MFTETDKRCSLSELVQHVCDGDTVAIGGGLSWREPMAALRELLRHGSKQLKLVGSAHGIDVDLLCGADAVSICAESYVGFEQDFGIAVNYRRACESGSIKVEDNCCYTLVQQLRAAISGLPFMPIRSMRGTDFLTLHPEFKTLVCPFTGDELILVPALRPDVAIIHAHYADQHGNIHIEGPPVADILFAKASAKVIVTVEAIISSQALSEIGVTIPYFYVTALSEVPYGAHPTACYPRYAYDRQHTALYYDLTKQGRQAFQEHYLNPYVYACEEHGDYLEAIGGEARLNRLASWNVDDAAWMTLYDV